ncbi:TerB family tellurite resistance protein [Duganella sp. BJB488]|uniref:tellurite resistance TerB family protein n=1 Tax=unclassified Duganella TaxID=2636909 RepID=UPI000E3424D9|nr:MULTISPECIES: TerB family tellurite resistance protein [unclassified Duganella]RFP13162.1 TerB family tellurite resistance protein [Duganella sp. BJB489]RFP17075.1 TerB family tellurite resistance protein [Duganella sp. BJB488]RFP31516.1 TerB family tellurite resistance protein [Duganella sp. BJB480]
MRKYIPDSASAAGRIVARCMVIDGDLASSELRALQRSRLLEFIEIDIDSFHALLDELCQDMLSSAVSDGHVELAPDMIAALLDEIRDPTLQQRLLHALWRIANADGVLADAEVTLLERARARWAPESRFVPGEAELVATR